MSREPHIDTAARAVQPPAAALAGAAGQPAEDWVYCPECGMPAWVEWAEAGASTAGPVEHVKVRCFSRHWFLMLRENLHR